MRAVLPLLQQALHAESPPHPAEDCLLFPPKEATRWRRVPARCAAPLCGIETRTAGAGTAPALWTRQGSSAHRATRRPVLGPRERRAAAEALRPARVPATAGQSPAVEGPRSASWARGALPQGPSTRLGRRMAGSPAVIAPHDVGQALVGTEDPPARPVSQVLVDAGSPGAGAPGTSRVVSARAVQAVALARAWAPQALGGRGMRDAHASHGLERGAAPLVAPRAEGPQGSRGPWDVPRPEDPRPWVLVEPGAGPPVVSWGPPTVPDVVAAAAGPQGSRERHARPAPRGKRLSDHGALKPPEGRTQRGGPARPPHRQRAPRAQALGGAHQRGATQTEAVHGPQAQGAASVSTGPGQRLAPRPRALGVVAQERPGAQHHHATRAAHVDALGPPGQRAARDGRKPTSLTRRTLRLEHARSACLGGLGARLQTQGRLAGLVRRLVERRGARMETDSQGVSWVHTAGCAVASQRLRKELGAGLWAIDVPDQGQPMCVRRTDLPP